MKKICFFVLCLIVLISTGLILFMGAYLASVTGMQKMMGDLLGEFHIVVLVLLLVLLVGGIYSLMALSVYFLINPHKTIGEIKDTLRAIKEIWARINIKGIWAFVKRIWAFIKGMPLESWWGFFGISAGIIFLTLGLVDFVGKLSMRHIFEEYLYPLMFLGVPCCLVGLFLIMIMSRGPWKILGFGAILGILFLINPDLQLGKKDGLFILIFSMAGILFANMFEGFSGRLVMIEQQLIIIRQLLERK